ncbi:hypothetical protein [uncultured Jannaschia sp.]|uniref:lysozyme inhibitor LprI family protein n=1 Tax=uncultured Jannaschia sp. TaxID=293347 RepID=UPI0026150FDE|nr:hypothetical protein [uncultured Jannaschia sp.]
MATRIAATLLAVFLSLPAAAQQPSFDCTRARLPAEHAICRDPAIAALDRRMATAFRTTLDGVTSAERERRRLEQRTWLGWRNTCARDAACLARRYGARIEELLAHGTHTLVVPPTGIVPPAGVTAATFRLRDGRYERVMPDGTIHWVAVGGGSMGTDYADGRPSELFMFQQVGNDDFPTLPGGAGPWSTQLEAALDGLVKRLIAPQDHARYDESHAGFSPSRRITHHVDALTFFLDD